MLIQKSLYDPQDNCNYTKIPNFSHVFRNSPGSPRSSPLPPSCSPVPPVTISNVNRANAMRSLADQLQPLHISVTPTNTGIIE